MSETDPIVQGAAHWRAGRLAEAETCFRAALAAADADADLHYALAAVIHGQGRAAEALNHYDRAASRAPRRADILSDFGAALNESGNPGAALLRLEAAAALDPGDADILNNLGSALLDLDRAGEAAEKFRAASAARPDAPEPAANHGRALLRSGDAEAAVTVLAEAAARFPRDGALKLLAASALPAVARSHGDHRRWRARLEREIAALGNADIAIARPEHIGGGSFLAAYHGLDDKSIQRQVATFHARACPALAYRAPHCAAPKARRDGLRVGFASAHFDGHTIARLNRGLIDGLDRERFEVTTFDLGPRGLADPFTAREAIAAAELDILYFPDIGMEPVSYFLGFARLAPVQCVTWGHPVTTGLPEIDYFVSIDAAEPVGAEASYSETLVRLPVFSTKVAPATAEPRPRGALGLPDAAHLYVCPQSLFKMHPDFDAALRGILDADPHASLLFVEGPQPHWREILEARWRKSFDFRRVRFLPRMPRADYLSCLAAADVVLDTFHFCGGHTSYEALALGKPVITLPGAFLRGRLTLAMLAQLGLDATVADNTDDYVRRAVAFGTDADLRTAFTRELAARRPLLFDDHRAVAAHERFFLDATAKAFC